jgi:NADH dehydrogenase (ubiquinone) 1 alpha subcomplex subunit 12
MSTLGRTLKNFMRAGPASSWKQLQYIGDTKYGALIGTDSVGNKYYENNDEIYGTINSRIGPVEACPFD